MLNKYSIYVKEKLQREGRSIRWLAQKVGISNVQMDISLTSWNAKNLRETARVLNIPVIEAYRMAGFFAESDLEEYSLGEKMDPELAKLLAVPGVREICTKAKLLFEKHPQDSNEIVRDLVVTLDKELAFRKVRDLAVRNKPDYSAGQGAGHLGDQSGG